MEGEYQRSACAMVGGKEDTERRRGRRQKCKGGEGNNNSKAMDLECIRGESVGSVGDKEECLNALPQNSPCLSLPSLQLRLGKSSSAQAGRAAHSPKPISGKEISLAACLGWHPQRAVGWGFPLRCVYTAGILGVDALRVAPLLSCSTSQKSVISKKAINFNGISSS